MEEQVHASFNFSDIIETKITSRCTALIGKKKFNEGKRTAYRLEFYGAPFLSQLSQVRSW